MVTILSHFADENTEVCKISDLEQAGFKQVFLMSKSQAQGLAPQGKGRGDHGPRREESG